MHILSLDVHNLFGIYNYSFQFRPDDSRLTILTGPNGYGKTTILKIISSLNVSGLYYFYTLKFDRIDVSFDDSSALAIESIVSEPHIHDTVPHGQMDKKASSEKQVIFTWQKGDAVIASFKYENKEIRKAQIDTLFEKSVRYNRHPQYSREDDDRDKILYTRDFNYKLARRQNQDGFMMQLEQLRTKFIPANRIYLTKENEDAELPIERIENGIQEKLNEIRIIYNSESTADDARFVNDLLSARESEVISRDHYEEISNKLQKNVDLFFQYLSIKIDIPSFDESKKDILSYYINRIDRKLTKCADLIGWIKLFDDMLQEKKFASKTVIYTPQQGIRVKSDSGDFIAAERLSSGEQNEIVMLYDMIFDLPDNSILLVDEPENSLHVAWQNMVVGDLQRIADAKHLQVIVATHSPTIVRYGKEFTQDLYYKQKSYESKS